MPVVSAEDPWRVLSRIVRPPRPSLRMIPPEPELVASSTSLSWMSVRFTVAFAPD
jgi:hypothetical protein